MLFDFRFETEVTVNNGNFTNANYSGNGTIMENDLETKLLISKPSFLQILLSFWVFTFFCEEIRQVISNIKCKNLF